MSATRIHEVDPGDDDRLARWHAVEAASVSAGAVGATTPHRSLAALTASVRHPSPYGGRVLLAAHDDRGETVGVAELSWSTAEDPDLCTAEVHVAPGARRRGVGRALAAEVDRRCRELGRSVVEGEVDVPAGELEGPTTSPGLAFAEALGFRTVHTEDHFVLALPVAPDHLARLAGSVVTSAAGYDVVTWWGRCPDEHVEAYCAMRNRMNADVPAGESAREAAVLDTARLRVIEQRLGRSYDVLVSAARHHETGEMAGYSLLFLDREDDVVLQDDTLVMPAHRGRRLGTLLKVANLEELAGLDPPRRVVHTWTAPTNAPMLAVNRGFGFVLASRSHEVQRGPDTR